jgi:hypothetical protein
LASHSFDEEQPPVKIRPHNSIALSTAGVLAISLGFVAISENSALAAKRSHTRPRATATTSPTPAATVGASSPNAQPTATTATTATTAASPSSVKATATAASPSPAQTTTTTAGPSGVSAPIGDISGWHQVFVDDFTINAPLGSWGTSDPSAVVYTGDHGGNWVEYPDGWSSTYTNGSPGYQPGQVLSVDNGVLDFYLHNVNGVPSGANPSPVLASGSSYQTYGRYTMRFRTDSHALRDYHIAWLLWPQDDANWQSAESDFPEADLGGTEVDSFAHFGGSGAQDAFSASIDFTQWHTYTQEWGPGYRKYYLDGLLIGTSTSQVTSLPERFQLQTEPNGSNDGDSGHLYVDWIAIYSPAN